MRLAILSDIHGNLPALQAVLVDLQQFAADAILVAGDLVAGPQPNEVISLLRSLNAWSIQSNNEIGLLDYHSGKAPLAWFTHKQFALGRWIFTNTLPESINFIRTLPVQAVYQADGLPPIQVVHGSPRDPYEKILPDLQPEILDIALAQIDETVLVCGHTHLAWCVSRNGKLALNPGALGCSLNGSPHASYALLTWQDNHWETIHRSIDYNLQAIKAAFHASGLLKEGGALARAFLLDIQTGHNVSMEFLGYAYHLAQEMGYPDTQYVPDAAWDQATQTFYWQNYSV
jgi:predicted phosphodiesterase